LGFVSGRNSHMHATMHINTEDATIAGALSPATFSVSGNAHKPEEKEGTSNRNRRPIGMGSALFLSPNQQCKPLQC
jgi:hypothetical protein